MWFVSQKFTSCLVTQSCPALCDPMDCSLPGFPVHGISQARILEWVAISFSRGSSWPRGWTWVSCIGRQILYPWSHQGNPDSHVKILILKVTALGGGFSWEVIRSCVKGFPNGSAGKESTNNADDTGDAASIHVLFINHTVSGILL